MQIHTLNLFPKPVDFTVQVEDTTGPVVKIREGNGEIIVYLMAGDPWNWDASALYRLAGQLVQAGQDLAAAAGQAELEDQEAV